MNRYLVLAPITFGAGVKLALDAAQIAAREHALRPVKVTKAGGTVETTDTVQFKAGEVIGVAGDLSRAQSVQLVEEAAKPKKTQEKAQEQTQEDSGGELGSGQQPTQPAAGGGTAAD